MALESIEQTRMAVLRSFDILDSPREEVFDALARLAAAVCGTPAAAICFQDGQRQWVKSKFGLKGGDTPHDPDVRFRASAPLISADGFTLGSLCVLDYRSRELSEEQHRALQELTGHVMAQLNLHKQLCEFRHKTAAWATSIGAVRRALAENQFVVYYQPTVDVSTGHISELEALLRWNHPEQGLLSPRDFMPFLEDSGLIVEVGSWVAHRAAHDYRQWLNSGIAAPRISINVSLQQFRHPGLIGDLERALDSDGTIRAALDIEISESLLRDESTANLQRLRELQNIGVHITLDDIGAGFASARYFAQLPIDAVKIDRELVLAMTRGPDDMDLVANLISLAHDLGLQIIAAGVETEEQRKLLRLLRCELMQGFYFAQPTTAADMEQILRSDQSQAADDWSLVLGDLR